MPPLTISHARLGLLFILVGPTGAGKNTLMNHVIDDLPDLAQLPTATTRPIRPNEKEGREHHFVTRQAFEQMIANDQLLEWQNVHGKLYGVPRQTVEAAIDARLDRIADVDILGAMSVQAAYPDNTVLVFIQPGDSTSLDDTTETIRERLGIRGESEAEIENRVARVQMELNHAHHCDYLIFNNDLGTAVKELHSVIAAERSRRDMANWRVRKGLPRRRLRQTVMLLITQGDDIYLRGDQLPTERILDGETPTDAASRSLRLQPINLALLGTTFNEMAYSDELCYWYHTQADDLPALDTAAWTSTPANHAAIPDAIRNALRQTTYETAAKPTD